VISRTTKNHGDRNQQELSFAHQTRQTHRSALRFAFCACVPRYNTHTARVALAIWSGQAIPTLPRARRVTTMWSWRALSAVRAPNSCLWGCQARRVCVRRVWVWVCDNPLCSCRGLCVSETLSSPPPSPLVSPALLWPHHACTSQHVPWLPRSMRLGTPPLPMCFALHGQCE
jgi:hypothetical protein